MKFLVSVGLTITVVFVTSVGNLNPSSHSMPRLFLGVYPGFGIVDLVQK
jgi:hypothetical protein